MHTIYEQNIPKRTLQKIMTNKDLSAYSKIIFICFIICLFKRGKKMQANCTLSLAEAFHIHYFLFTYLVIGKQFPAVKLFSRNCYLGKQKILSKYFAYYRCFFIEARKLFRNSKHKGVLNNLLSILWLKL